MSDPSQNAKVFSGMQLNRFVPGRAYPNSASASDMNRIVDVLNAILRARVDPQSAGQVTFSDSDMVIRLTGGGGGGGTGGGFNWRGEYSSSTTYSVNDVVRVSTTYIYGDGNNYTGVWLCVASSTGNQPIFPEPGTPHWVMLSMGPRTLNVADSASGNKQQLVAASDPY